MGNKLIEIENRPFKCGS